MTIDEAIHAEIERSGTVSYGRRAELAKEYGLKMQTVTEEVRGAFRQRATMDTPAGMTPKDWHRQRVLAELDAAKKLAKEDGDVSSLVRAIIADATVCGLMTQKVGKKAGDGTTAQPSEQDWREALDACPPALLRERYEQMKARH